MTAEEQIAQLKKELAEEREENGRAARASWTHLDAGGQPGGGRASVEEASCGTPSGASRRWRTLAPGRTFMDVDAGSVSELQPVYVCVSCVRSAPAARLYLCPWARAAGMGSAAAWPVAAHL